MRQCGCWIGCIAYSRNQIAATILHLIATEGITTEAADDVSLIAINRFPAREAPTLPT